MTLRPVLRRMLTVLALVVIWNVVLLLSVFGPPPTPVLARAPQLWLPTPIGERWQVTQGFQCGSHVGTQARSLDLVNLDGPTAGAPIRAAADGTTFVWQGSTGTLIIAHGYGYYTMYTHLQQVITTRRGLAVRQGDVIGRAGSVGTSMPHLHFTFFYAPDPGAYNRTSLELDFADGYSLRDKTGCNQHRGTILIARAEPDTIPPEVHFQSDAKPGTWYCEDQRIDFTITDNRRVRGFSQAFNRDPGGETPDFEGDTGYVQLGWKGDGMHILYVRAWDHNNVQTLATFGPIGLDTTPPTFEAPAVVPAKSYPAGTPLNLSWNPADDGEGSGIAGYKLYLGTDRKGTSDWFTEKPAVKVPGMAPGRYVLRAQAIDNACHASAWITLQEVIVTAEERASTPTLTPTSTPLPPTGTPLPPTGTPLASPSPTAEAGVRGSARGSPPGG